MTHTPQLRVFVAAWEGLRLTAYDDGGGVWTIGYGHTAGVCEGDHCTVSQAETWLTQELAACDLTINQSVTTIITQQQHDACASFIYNLGATNFRVSTLLKMINAGAAPAAAPQFLRWNKQGDHVLRGLLARRAGEALIYAFGDYSGT